MHKSISLAVLCLFAGAALPVCAQSPAPLRALLLTGGCCHDYAAQKDILKQGLEARANVKVDIIYAEVPPHTDATKPPLPIYGNADYGKGYDVIIHDECASGINDPEVVNAVLAPHRAGIPGVVLHCGVHCYRIGDPAIKAEAGSERAQWFDFLGLQSSGHGSQLPITITVTDPDFPIMRGLSGWTTIHEELYNNVQLFPTLKPLARGKQTYEKDGATHTDDYVSVWVNDYHGTRVFCTTIGHNNETVSDSRYLDMVARGLLWACGKMDNHGDITTGYGPKS